MRRWAPAVLATVLTAVLAIGMAAGVGRLAESRTGDVPRLATVPPDTLARLGIALSPGHQPPYCGLAAATPLPIEPGWIACAISRATAEATALQGGQGRVTEAVLARVSGAPSSTVGQSRLAWLVVLQRSATMPAGGACAPQGSGWMACALSRTLTRRQLVLVDGLSGLMVTSFNLSPAGPGRSTLRMGGAGAGGRYPLPAASFPRST